MKVALMGFIPLTQVGGKMAIRASPDIINWIAG
jgi:hypothetical protein